MADAAPLAVSRCAAIVLAAGSSTRLGQPKQLVLYQGEPLLRRTLQLALDAGASPVLVVLGAYAAECRSVIEALPVTITENPDHGAGMGGGLRLGMAALTAWEAGAVPSHRLLLLVCDQPLLRLDHLELLLAAEPAESIVAAAYNGRVGVPAVFDRRHFAALAAVTGDQGARSLLREQAVTPVAMPEAAIDIDTPADLDALQALL